MPNFNYFSRDISGKSVKGMANAASRNDMVAALKSRNLIPISVREARPFMSLKWSRPNGIRLTEIAFFFRQLATMITAGIAINETLGELSSQIKNPALSKVAGRLRDEIEKGSDFSQSLAMFPDVFQPAPCKINSISIRLRVGF